MAAFDTALTPVSAAPADTNNAALDPGQSADCTVLVDIANIHSTDNVKVRWGITPSGGSVHWKGYDVAIAAGDSLNGLGPYVLQVGDVITVRTDTANIAVFSLTGLESSA